MKKLVLGLSVVLVMSLFSSLAFSSQINNKSYCWEKDGFDASKIESVINHFRGFKFRKLEIQTQGEGYLQYPQLYTNWWMDNGFSFKLSNHSAILEPLRIGSNNELSSQTVTIDNTWISVSGEGCNTNHECSFKITLQAKNNQTAKFAEIKIDVRKHRGIYVQSGSTGNIYLIASNSYCN